MTCRVPQCVQCPGLVLLSSCRSHSSSRHTTHSLRRGPARRSWGSAGRRGHSGVGGCVTGRSSSLGTTLPCYLLPQTGVRPEVAEMHRASWWHRRCRLWAGPHLRAFSRSLRRGSARRSRIGTGRRGCSGPPAAYRAGLRHEASSSHAAHSLRQASVRRSQDCTGRRGGSGVVSGTPGGLNLWVFPRHASRFLRRGSARRPREGTGCCIPQPCCPLPQTGVCPEVAGLH